MARDRNWSPEQWHAFEQSLLRRLTTTQNENEAFRIIANGAWRVLRNYSTSFFIVTRFLPRAKRRAVEVIYAAVRYPDEIVDTFSVSVERKVELLSAWRQHYSRACRHGSLLESINAGVPPFVAAFAEVVRRYNIPPEYYHAFLDAMEYDTHPTPFETFADLIERYVYGSAIVVGYFLTYVYGVAPGYTLEEALGAARSLGIALQLTNFLRDVREDHLRQRCYVPQQLLAELGVTYEEFLAGTNRRATEKIVERYAAVAWQYYQDAERHLGAFDPACVPAIAACIGVYGELTTMLEQQKNPTRRASVPWWRKFACLPSSKYWIIPVSFITPEYRP